MNYTLHVTIKSDDKESLANMLKILASGIHDPSMGSNQVAALGGKLIFKDKDSIEWSTDTNDSSNVDPLYCHYLRRTNNYGKTRF